MTPAEALHAATHLNATQIEHIVEALALKIAAPEDQAFFKGILTIKAERSTSSEFAVFVGTLLKGTT